MLPQRLVMLSVPHHYGKTKGSYNNHEVDIQEIYLGFSFYNWEKLLSNDFLGISIVKLPCTF